MRNKEQITEELKSLLTKANTMLNASQNRQRTTAYLYIIFSFVALSLFGLFAIGPTITTISDLNKEYEEGKIALKQLEDKNAALKSLSAQYLDIQNDLVLIDNAIPSTPAVAQMARQLESLSNRNNLIVQKLDSGLMEIFPAKNANAPIFSYSFTITVLGAEQDVNKFIGEVINMGRIIGVDKLTTGKQQNNLYAASIAGRVFSYRP